MKVNRIVKAAVHEVASLKVGYYESVILGCVEWDGMGWREPGGGLCRPFCGWWALQRGVG